MDFMAQDVSAAANGRGARDPDLILHQIVARHARAAPGAIATRFGDRTLTYAALDDAAARIAGSLSTYGLPAGGRIMFLGRNSDAVALLIVAASRIGAVFIPLNWRLAVSEIATLIGDSDASFLFYEADFGESAMAASAMTAAAPILVPADAIRPDGEWLRAAPLADPDGITGNTVLLLIYTSGTTGVPKGVMHSHRSLLSMNAIRNQQIVWDRWSANDIILVLAPLGHIGALIMLLRGLFFGAETIIHTAFDAAAVLDAIARQRVTKIGLVPTAIKMLVEHPTSRDRDYSSLSMMLYGSAPMPLAVLRDAIDVFGCGFGQTYGMTETCGGVIALPPSDHDIAGNARMVTAGTAMPGTEVRVVDEDGGAVAPGVIGELTIRSPSNMIGYWRREQETAAVLSPDGWLRTGDAGSIDGDGYVTVHARIKDMINSGGENIYPAEVENAIGSCPQVADVAVFGISDDHWGEVVVAAVVAAPGPGPTPDEIVAWTRRHIAGYKVPRRIIMIDQLPLTAAGKVDRAALRRSLVEAAAAD